MSLSSAYFQSFTGNCICELMKYDILNTRSIPGMTQPLEGQQTLDMKAYSDNEEVL